MSAMPSFDLFTIGHSNIAPERFVAMLQDAGVNMIADVRSLPASRRFPWFSKEALAARLARAGIGYLPMGDTLGGRPRHDALYRDGVADYEAMASQPEFLSGLDRLSKVTAQARVCLLCAERDPLDCHRGLLVARRLAERGQSVGHILHDGTIAPHAAIEARLLPPGDGAADLFPAGQAERLAAAYRRRARAVAFRRKSAPAAVAETK